MNYFEKYANKNWIKLGIFGVIFLGWLIPYLMPMHYAIPEIIGQLLVVAIACASLVLFKDTRYFIEILLLFPFMFSRPFTLNTFPIHLVAIVVLALGGLVAHIVIHRPKLSIPKFFIGFAAIAVSLVTGGLLMEYDDKFFKMFMMFWMGFGLLAVYIFLSSTTKTTFKDLSFLIVLLGSFLVLQVMVYALGHLNVLLLEKKINVGWGSTNNIAMILLFTIPYTFYYAFKEKNIKIKIGVHVITALELVCIILSFSRGGLGSAIVSYFILFLILVIRKDTRKEILAFAGSFIGVLVIAVVLLAITRFDMLKSAIANLTKINLNSLNGRAPIYERMLTELKDQPIFGFGVYHSFTDNPDYTWGHNTFLQTAYTLGIFGLIGMVYHHLEKYIFCLKKINLEKIIVLIGFVATDIYGFMDVSYFFINFMIVLIIILVALNSAFNKEGLVNENYSS